MEDGESGAESTKLEGRCGHEDGQLLKKKSDHLETLKEEQKINDSGLIQWVDESICIHLT
ncbi:hypothetical protein HHI36_003000, partial [Cryptolaemus montrouzieri]